MIWEKNTYESLSIGTHLRCAGLSGAFCRRRGLGSGRVKQGLKPTRAQRKRIQQQGLIPDNWLVSKDTSEEMTIVHRLNDQVRVIPKTERSKG